MFYENITFVALKLPPSNYYTAKKAAALSDR